MEKNIQVKDLGIITLRTSPRATRYSLKISRGKIIATMPIGGNEQHLLSFIIENKERLRKGLKKYPAQPLIDEDYQLQATTFRVRISRTERTNFYMQLQDGILQIACPHDTDFADENIQATLKAMVENALRHEAKRLLPSRIRTLANAHGFTFSDVKINNSKTHWGSCTARKSINLSLSLMLLPWHLVDYVLLHELCHTIEMNHGERFWALMDKVTNQKSATLRNELKSYHML